MLRKLFVSDLVEDYTNTIAWGPPVEKTPESYIEHLILSRRQTGRTTFMINSFPDKGRFYVIFYKPSRGFEIKNKVKTLRGEEVANNMVVVSLSGIDSLLGSQGPIYIDDEIFDSLAIDFHSRINKGDLLPLKNLR